MLPCYWLFVNCLFMNAIPFKVSTNKYFSLKFKTNVGLIVVISFQINKISLILKNNGPGELVSQLASRFDSQLGNQLFIGLDTLGIVIKELTPSNRKVKSSYSMFYYFICAYHMSNEVQVVIRMLQTPTLYPILSILKPVTSLFLCLPFFHRLPVMIWIA